MIRITFINLMFQRFIDRALSFVKVYLYKQVMFFKEPIISF